MIRFNIYIGYKKIFFNNIVNSLESRAIYQTELSTYLFYGSGKIKQIDFNVSNKMIKREAYIRALNSLNNYYLNIYMINYEDGVLNYILYRNVRSFFFLKKIAYYYIRNKDSITMSKFNNKTLKFIFIHLKIVFEYSKNTKYEKNMVNDIFERICINTTIKNRFRYLNEEYKFFNDIINMLLDNKFITIQNKNYLKKIKNI